MDRKKTLASLCALVLAALSALSQETPATPSSTSQSSISGNEHGPASKATTVRGCLERSRGNYLLVEDKTGLIYALKSVDGKLDGQVGREIEVTGQLLTGTIKTGIRSEKQGSNPSDTIHGIDGSPFQVADVHKDVRRVAARCTAADKQ
jgi:hypothetical protein